jgi:hypothetical protein
MAEPVAGRPVSWGFAWSAAIGAAVVTFLLTVVMPPTGFLVGIAGLVALCVGLARRRTSLLTAVSAGVVAAVVCYLGIWIAGSIVDPGAPDNGSGSSAGKPSEISVHPHHFGFSWIVWAASAMTSQ